MTFKPVWPLALLEAAWAFVLLRLFNMFNTIQHMTLRQLAKKSPSTIRKRLTQLNIGLSNKVYGAWASKWSIGYHEPTIEDIIVLKNLIARGSVLCSTAIDTELTLQSDWTKHFGQTPTGPMM